MIVNRWKTGLSVVAMVVGLLTYAMPAMGGQIAQYDSGTGSLAPLAALDGSCLTLTNGQSVVVKFATPVQPILGSEGYPYFTLRIHMDGTTAGVEGTQISLRPDNPEAQWRGFLGDSWPNLIAEYLPNPEVSGDGLTGDWFQFAVYSGIFSFTEFQYVRIQAPAGVSISIDAVEAPEFTTLPPAPPDPLVMIVNLIDKVADYNFQQGIENSLDAKLDAAFQALDDVNTNNDASAVNKLEAFINEVNAQRNKKITDAQATALVADAQAIIAALNAP